MRHANPNFMIYWEHIDRKDKDYFELGVTKICKAAGLGDGAT